jgi:hypothetical protein
MTYGFRGILLFAFLFCIVRLLGRRRIDADGLGRQIAPARPDAAPIPCNSTPVTTRAALPASVPISAMQRGTPGDYLLGGRPSAGRPDRSAAMMDMMSGPGICTPRDF